MLSTLLGAKVGATVAGVAVALGGTAVVVYAGSLHTGSQNAAHSVIGAPAAAPTGTASPHPSATKTATGPDVTGSAAFGLCNAWSHHQAKGANTHGKSKDAPPFRNLVTAAGGADKVAAFCAAIPHPTDTSEPSDEPSTESTPAHPTGRPSSLPTPSSPGHGTGRPSTLPTPSSGHPTGKPSSLPTPTSAPPA